MNQNGQEVYLEPAVEINRESVDPLGTSGLQSEPNNINVCSPGGC
jgi:hypothetical protein